jgi:hypothetical protein
MRYRSKGVSCPWTVEEGPIGEKLDTTDLQKFGEKMEAALVGVTPGDPGSFSWFGSPWKVILLPMPM